jgi:hypothetical protein
MNCILLKFLTRYCLFVYLSRKVNISFFRNRLSPLGPTRKLGNTPKLVHLLTVLMWIFNKLATSLVVSKESVSSTSTSEIPSTVCSVVAPSIPDHSLFGCNTPICLKIRTEVTTFFSEIACRSSVQCENSAIFQDCSIF